MTTKNADAMAEAFVKQAESFFHKSVAKFALRELFLKGMTTDEIEGWVEEVLEDIELESKDKAKAAKGGVSGTNPKTALPKPMVTLSDIIAKIPSKQNDKKKRLGTKAAKKNVGGGKRNASALDESLSESTSELSSDSSCDTSDDTDDTD